MKVECEQLKNKTLDKTSEETKRCVDEFKELNESWKRLTQDKVPWTVRGKKWELSYQIIQFSVAYVVILSRFFKKKKVHYIL